MHSGKLKYVVFQGTKMIKEGEICYDVPASERLIQQEKPETVIITGNRRSAIPLAYFLKSKIPESQIRYIGPPSKERGEKLKNIRYLEIALENGLRGGPFFKRKSFDGIPHHRGIELAKEYSRNKDQQRRVKHLIQSELRVVLPEVFRGKIKRISSKKGRKLLMRRDYRGLLELCEVSVNTLFQDYLPESEKREREKRIIKLIEELNRLEEEEKEIRRKIIEITEGKCIVELFEGAFSARLFALFVDGREFKEYRHLRAFVGLSLRRIRIIRRGSQRIEKLGISRVRPELRTALFNLLRTKIAKKVIAERMKDYKGKKPPARCKMLEWLLKFIWQNCFAS